jgi:hypothetical protein
VHEYSYLKHLEDKCQAAARLQVQRNQQIQVKLEGSTTADPASAFAPGGGGYGTSGFGSNVCGNNSSAGGNHGFPPFYAPAGMLDCDTPLQPQSLEAAKRFCGYARIIYPCFCICFVTANLSAFQNVYYSAAILAVDHVMQSVLRQDYAGLVSSTSATKSEEKQTQEQQQQGHCRRAFVIGRPPGHHAGPNGYAFSS